MSIGALAGAPINNPGLGFFNPYLQSLPSRWTGGPKFEVHLPKRFSVEVDAIYRVDRHSSLYSYTNGPAAVLFQSQTSTRAKTWDFPILAKYRLPVGPVRPFLSGGILLSRRSNAITATATCLASQEACSDPNLYRYLGSGRIDYTSRQAGPVAGAGVEFKTKYLTIAPEVRVSRIDRNHQVTGFVGFTWRPRRR